MDTFYNPHFPRTVDELQLDEELRQQTALEPPAAPPPDPRIPLPAQSAQELQPTTHTPEARDPGEWRMEALTRAQSRDNAAASANELSNNIYNAFTGRPVQNKAGGDNAQQLAQRQALEDNQAKHSAEMEGSDPRSGTSQATRELIRKALPQLAEQMGPSFERLSHAKAKDLFPFLSSYMSSIEKAQKSKAAVAKGQNILTLIRRDVSPERLSQFGPGELEAMSPDVLEKFYSTAAADRRFDTGQEGALERVKIAQSGANIRSQPSRDLTTTNLKAREVFGAEPLDAANPHALSQDQSSKLAEMKAAFDTVKGKTDEAKRLYGKGGFIVPGSTQEALLRQLIVETYGPMLKTGNIGNLTDSHLHLLTDMLDNPGNWKNYVNDARFPAMLESVVHGAESNLEAQANSLGRTFKHKEPLTGSFELGGLSPEKSARLQELRRKKQEGKLK